MCRLEVDDLISVCRDIADRIRELQELPFVRTKVSEKCGNVVWGIDLIAENLVIEYFRELGVGRLITEDRGLLILRDGRSDVAVVDPLDGSTNYVLGIPACCISVAYGCGSRLCDLDVGVVIGIYPRFEVWVVKGREVVVRGLKVVSSGCDVSIVSLYLERGYELLVRKLSELLGSVKVRHLGYVALELLLVGTGSITLFIDLRNRLRLTDVAAPYVICRELGVQFVDVLGEDIGYVPLVENTRLRLVAGRVEIIKSVLPLIKGILRDYSSR